MHLNFSFSQIFNDAEFNEKNNNFLEGTGSMVLDRVNQIVYAALSERTCQDLLNEFLRLYCLSSSEKYIILPDKGLGYILILFFLKIEQFM